MSAKPVDLTKLTDEELDAKLEGARKAKDDAYAALRLVAAEKKRREDKAEAEKILRGLTPGQAEALGLKPATVLSPPGIESTEKLGAPGSDDA